MIIVPDKDEPGRKHAEDIIEILEDVKASSVRVVEAETGSDAADHIAAELAASPNSSRRPGGHRTRHPRRDARR